MGKPTYVSSSPHISGGHRLSVYRCQCGALFETRPFYIDSGHTASCGCAKLKLKHGLYKSGAYKSWIKMKGRCKDVHNSKFEFYASMSHDLDLLENFMEFYGEVGDRPRGHSIDRIDNSIGYVRGNLRWATKKQQSLNTKNSYGVIIKGVYFDNPEEAGKALGVSTNTVYVWLNGYKKQRRMPWAKKVPKYQK